MKYLLWLSIIFLVIGLGLALYVNSVVSYGLPSLEQLENPKQNLATRIISSDGVLLDHFYIERRVNIPLDSVPKDFINALIVTEDKYFYSHWGVYTERIFKAAIKNIFAGKVQEGASTITMQLARNLFGYSENTLERKIREAFTAIQIERTYTKEEILEMYINTVAFGRGAYGLQVASKIYFDKNPSELTTAECAYLAALLKAPEHYNGLNNIDKAVDRRNLVLTLMLRQGKITPETYMKAIEEPINIVATKKKQVSYLAPHFVEMVRQKFSKEDNSLIEYDLYRDGLVIYTTLNAKIQQYANEAVEEHLLEFQKLFEQKWSWNNNKKLLEDLIMRAINNRPDYRSAIGDKKKQIEIKLRNDKEFIDSIKNSATTIQVGLVVLNPFNGEILALVGASPKFMKEHRDAKYSLNHATQIRRQAGSAFKPFVYALVLEKGLTPNTMIECGPFSYRIPETGEVWSPGGGGCGPGEKTTLYDALRKSINSVAARLVTSETSPQEVVELAKRLGIESRLQPVPAIALGAGGEITPLELTSAFGAFLYEGIYVKPNYIYRVEDKFGNTIYERKKVFTHSRAINPEVTGTLTFMLQAVVNSGTGWRVKQFLKDCDAAGKTGTTNDYGDAWFVGYTPELVAGCWVGFDDLRIKFGAYGEGGRAAAPIWGRLMQKIYNDKDLPYKKRKFDFKHFEKYDSLYQQTFLSYNQNLNKKSENIKIGNSDRKESDFKFPQLPRPEDVRN